MTTFSAVAVCGPFGAPLQDFATRLAHDRGATLICAQQYEDDETWRVDDEQLINQLDDNQGLVIVYGHFLLTNENIRKQMKLKLFLQQDSDSCIASILNQHQQQLGKNPSLLATLCDRYETYQKPANDDCIHASKQYADIILPAQNGYSTAVQSLLCSFEAKTQQHSMQSSSRMLFYKPQKPEKKRRFSAGDAVNQQGPSSLHN